MNAKTHPDPRQVFWEYDYRRKTPPAYRFCPLCSTELIARDSDGRMMCAACLFVEYRNPSPGVVVMIERDDRVLLGLRGETSNQRGKWCFPGGFVEHGEDFLSAAIREVKEETNLDVEILSIISVISNFFAPSLHTLVVNLFGRVMGGAARAGDDLVDIDWFPLTGPLPELAFEAEAHIIERYRAERIAGAPVDPRFSVAR